MKMKYIEFDGNEEEVTAAMKAYGLTRKPEALAVPGKDNQNITLTPVKKGKTTYYHLLFGMSLKDKLKEFSALQPKKQKTIVSTKKFLKLYNIPASKFGSVYSQLRDLPATAKPATRKKLGSGTFTQAKQYLVETKFDLQNQKIAPVIDRFIAEKKITGKKEVALFKHAFYDARYQLRLANKKGAVNEAIEATEKKAEPEKFEILGIKF